MKYRKRLFSVKYAYSFDDELFIKAVSENFLHLTKHCDDYRRIAGHYGFSAESCENIKAIPHNYCRAITQSDFSSDFTKATQAGCRPSRSFCARWRKICK